MNSRHLRLRAISLVAIGAAACFPSHAQTWKNVGESEAGTFYYDARTVRKDGELRLVWRLVDLKATAKTDGGAEWKSGSSLVEIDCRRRTFRYAQLLYYNQPMGTGLIVESQRLTNDVPDHIAPGSVIESLSEEICS